MADPSVKIQIKAEDMTQAVLLGIQEGFKRVEAGIKQSAASSAKSADSLRQVATSAKGAEAGIEVLISRFGGLAAAAAAAGATIKAGISDALELDRLNTKFKAASGSAEEAGFAMQYVREESKRLGLDVRTTADNFGRLLIATKNTALEGEGARKIFTGFGTAFTALGVTSDEAGRIFQQMTQGINKGKVELEDAKIIAEAGIPIFDLFAQAIGKSRPEIMKMISDGQLTTDIYLKVAESLDKAYGADAAARLSGTEKQYQLMKNELFETSAAFGKDLLPAATMVIKVLSGGIEVVGAFWSSLKELVSLVVAAGAAMFEFGKLTMGGGMFSEEGRREFAQGMEAIKGMVVDQFNNMGAAGQKYHKSQEKLAEERAKSEKQRLKEAADQVAANKKASEDYFKLIADEEQRLMAKGQQEFTEKTTTVKNYFEARLKAVQKGSEEELKIQAEYKTALANLEREKAALGAVAAVTARKNVLAQQESIFNQEIALIEAKVAKEKGFEIEGSAIISGLKVKQAKDEYDLAQQRISILRVSGQTGTEEYKKSLDAMYKAHAAYLNESTAAYKKYADNIKAIDQQIKDFRSSIQDKIRDIQQKGMTDAQKYADDQKRYDEAVSASRAALAAKDYDAAMKFAKQAEELAGRLVDKKAESNTKLQQIELEHQQKIKDIQGQSSDSSKLTDQQKQAADIARENAEYEKKRAEAMKEQAATQQGIATATQALNQVEQLGVQIMEAKKKENQDALAKLQEIQNMKLDPKNLAVNMDNAALESVKSQIAALTATETKTIIIKTVGASGEASYSNTGGATEGFFAGGKVTNGSPLQDSVHAMLARNEWVINNKAAGFWGDNLLAAINAPLSSSGRRLQETLRSVPSPTQPNVTPMGTINLDIGGGSFPMSAPIDVLAELNTALRRRKMTRPNP